MLISLLWDLIVALGIAIALGLLILFFVFFIFAIQILIYAKNSAMMQEVTKDAITDDKEGGD